MTFVITCLLKIVVNIKFNYIQQTKADKLLRPGKFSVQLRTHDMPVWNWVFGNKLLNL